MSHVSLFGNPVEITTDQTLLVNTDGTIDVSALQYTREGVGVYSGFFVDTHFGSRGRQGRLVRFMDHLKKNVDFKFGNLYGVGIDRDAAILIENVKSLSCNPLRVLGLNGASIFDIKETHPNHKAGDSWSLSSINFHYLSEDDYFNIITGDYIIAPYKSPVFPEDSAVQYSIYVTDVFNMPDSYSNEKATVHQAVDDPRTSDDVLEFFDVVYQLVSSTDTKAHGLVTYYDPDRLRPHYNQYILEFIKESNGDPQYNLLAGRQDEYNYASSIVKIKFDILPRAVSNYTSPYN
jgi:hypothetical protein